MKSAFEKLIRPAYVPQKSKELSGVVYVLDDKGRGYAYVKFEDRLIDIVAKKMPFGVGEAHPAYLIVRKIPNKAQYLVECEYIDRSKRVRLWEQKTFPTWVKKIFRGEAYDSAPPKKKRSGYVSTKRIHPESTMTYDELSSVVESYAKPIKASKEAQAHE